MTSRLLSIPAVTTAFFFLHAIQEFRKYSPLVPKNVYLDSAHDNIPTYELLKHWKINALIDINGRSTRYNGLPPDITLDKTGQPLCLAGFPKAKWGFEKNKGGHKYRCPLKCGRVKECSCTDQCSKSSYGREPCILKLNGIFAFIRRSPETANNTGKSTVNAPHANE